MPDSEPCLFCQLSNGENGRWYDEILFEDDSSFVVPALGALVGGHVLLCSRTHYDSAAESPQLRALLNTVETLRKSLERLFARPVIVFEHGTSRATAGSGCISHAHFQLLPIEIDLSLPTDMGFETITAASSIRTLAGRSYLLWSPRPGEYLVSVKAERSQFFRRLIVGPGSDEWDWALFQNEETMRQTITQCRGRL